LAYALGPYKREILCFAEKTATLRMATLYAMTMRLPNCWGLGLGAGVDALDDVEGEGGD